MFDVVGFYDWDREPTLSEEVYVHYEYLNEARAIGRDTVNMFVVRATDGNQSAAVSTSLPRLCIHRAAPFAADDPGEHYVGACAFDF